MERERAGKKEGWVEEKWEKRRHRRARTKLKTDKWKEGQNVKKEEGERAEKEGGWAVTLLERKGSERVSPIKRGCGCICSTYSQQILIYGRVIKLVLNLSTAPPYNYIHRGCVKRASDLASSAWEGVCVSRHVCKKGGGKKKAANRRMSEHMRATTHFLGKT